MKLFGLKYENTKHFYYFFLCNLSSKSSQFVYELFLCYFLLLYFIKKIILWFFTYFLKSNFLIWTTRLSLAFFYKIKNIILLNVTHFSLKFLYCLVIYIFFYFYNIFWYFRSFNIWIFELFFCIISNCNTNWSYTRANDVVS